MQEIQSGKTGLMELGVAITQAITKEDLSRLSPRQIKLFKNLLGDLAVDHKGLVSPAMVQGQYEIMEELTEGFEG